MYGMEQDQKKEKKESSLELEKQLTTRQGIAQVEEVFHAKIVKIKNLQQQGLSLEDFDALATMLKGYESLQQITLRARRRLEQ